MSFFSIRLKLTKFISFTIVMSKLSALVYMMKHTLIFSLIVNLIALTYFVYINFLEHEDLLDSDRKFAICNHMRAISAYTLFLVILMFSSYVLIYGIRNEMTSVVILFTIFDIIYFIFIVLLCLGQNTTSEKFLLFYLILSLCSFLYAYLIVCEHETHVAYLHYEIEQLL